MLKGLSRITLKDAFSASLLNRIDTKFVFSEDLLPEIIKDLTCDYRVLELNETVVQSYSTTYYDFIGLKLYKDHHNGKLSRYKIRHRMYNETNEGFLEIKQKNNKGRTIKQRIKKSSPPENWDKESILFLEKNLHLNAKLLKPELKIFFNRLTLINPESNERLTIDTNLKYETGGRCIICNGLVIAEVKQSKKTPSVFINMMKRLSIRPRRISKYCVGIAFLCDSVKKNNFKQNLRFIKKIINDSNRVFANS